MISTKYNVFLIDFTFKLDEEAYYRFLILKKYITSNWHSIRSSISNVDYVIINWFWYLENIWKRVLDYIEYVNLKNKSTKIILYWNIAGSSLYSNKLDYVQLVTLKNKVLFDDIFYNNILIYDVKYDEDMNWCMYESSDENIFFNIEIWSWCSNKDCKYCFFYKSRNSVKSKKIIDIKKEFNYALLNDNIDIHLLWDDLVSYWKDIWTSFDILFNDLCSIKWHYSISLDYCDPAWFIKMYNKIKDNIYKVTTLFIPILSYSNKLLDNLWRKYTHNELLSILEDIKKRNPTIKLYNLIIYWIPWESMDDFLLNFKKDSLYTSTVLKKYNYKLDNSTFKNSIDCTDIKIKEKFISKLIKIKWCKYEIDTTMGPI